MNALILNPSPEQCGVHQYGLRFYEVCRQSTSIQFSLASPEHDVLERPDVVIYNWHPLIDPHCGVIERPEFRSSKKVILYHDGTPPGHIERILFSAPNLPVTDSRWRMIGRPLPMWSPIDMVETPEIITVGISGFCGAWAEDAVAFVVKHLRAVRFRMQLPPSYWCDNSGETARAMVDRCRLLLRPDDKLEVTHEFMSERDLLLWLSGNHINCYIRNSSPSLGISSAIDNALAVRKPIAINRNPMFRHLFGCNPSICVEDTPLREILSNGMSPLVPVLARNHPSVVRNEVEFELHSL